MDEDAGLPANRPTAMPGCALRRPQAKPALHDELNAVALLTQAIVQDEHLTEAYLLRAEILRDMGSLTEAEADIDHLLEDEKAQPAPEEAVMLKAALRLQQGDAPTAITYYNKVKTQNPLMGRGIRRTQHGIRRQPSARPGTVHTGRSRRTHAGLQRRIQRTRTHQTDAQRQSRSGRRPEKSVGDLAGSRQSPRRTVQQHRTRDERTIQKPQPLRFLNVIKIRYSFTFFPFKRKKAVKTFAGNEKIPNFATNSEIRR